MRCSISFPQSTRFRFAERALLARLHRYLPLDTTLVLEALLDANVARHRAAVQQLMRLRQIGDVAAVPITLRTKPFSASAPTWAFMPKYH